MFAGGVAGVFNLAGFDGGLCAVAGPDDGVAGEDVEAGADRFEFLHEVRVGTGAAGASGEAEFKNGKEGRIHADSIYHQ